MNAFLKSPATRQRIVPIAIGLALVIVALVFWQPLRAWFTGETNEDDDQTATSAHEGHDPAPAPAPAAKSEPEAKTEAPALPQHQFPEPALTALQNAFTALEEVRALLARDEAKGIATPAGLVAKQVRAASAGLGDGPPEIAAALSEATAAADKLAGATALDDARRRFGELSRFLVALGSADERLQAGWHLFQCPMVTEGFPKWFQKSEKLENPHMGQKMSTCGSSSRWESGAAGAAGATKEPASAARAMSHEGHGHDGDDVAYYTCSMHPSVQQKQPGTCPICSMNLTPVSYEETESGVVRVDEVRRQRIGVKSAQVGRSPMSVTVRAVGRLTYDETRLKDVTLKVKGWVARLRVNETGQPVRKGETLLWLYSPELYAAQQEYLLALDSHKTAGAGGRSDYLLKAADKKLRLWGMTAAQLEGLARRSEPIEEVPILAPASGFIIEKDVVEGAAVEPGQRLFRIASLERVWVEAQVYELDLGQVRKGQKALVTLPYQPGDAIEGTVAYVYPYLDPTSRTGRVRIELPNRELAFKPDMYANVEIRVDRGPRLQIPVDAVVYTGPRRLVFLDLGEGRFRPQEVTLGVRSGEAVEVVSGLSPGDLIVTSGNFLIAAESRLRSAASMWSDEVTGEKPRGSDPSPAPAPSKAPAKRGQGGGHAGH